MHSKYLWGEVCRQLNWGFFPEDPNYFAIILHDMYHNSQLTPKEISDYIYNNSEEKIKITPR
jgi:hypothetical protein